MNIVMRYVYAIADVVVIRMIALPVVADPSMWIWYGLCVALAFMLRLGMEHKRHRLTTQTLFYQCIYTISWIFFAILIWDYFYKLETQGFSIYLFVNSLFASFLVSQFEQIFEKGFKAWLQIKLGKFLAVESGKDEKVNVTKRKDSK